uniref:ADF-H domain-containing protein n=1 Tax=Lactuca sativa TaxID=4236 RepID=A0A9R1WCF5_LACSA|nr:hypothetical protein LSAT_V11C200099700 [Lactuca sativa]
MGANAASGMAVDDQCKLKFLELKAKRNYRFITYKIEDQQVIVDKIGGPDKNYEDFTNSLPGDECRYAVFDFDFTTDENCQKSKIIFIAWLTPSSVLNKKIGLYRLECSYQMKDEGKSSFKLRCKLNS